MASKHQKPVGRAVVYGAISFLLYALIYVYEEQVLQLATKGGWYFVLPVLVAFVFSFFHGGFTSYFWEVLGVRPKIPESKQK